MQREINFALKLARDTQRQLHIHVELADLDSEALYGLVKAKARFDPARGQFAAFARFFIVGTMRDFLAARNQKPFAMLEDERSYREDFDTASADVRHAVSQLPARLQSVIRLRYWGGFSHTEIARELGVNYARSWQLEQSALKMLRAML